MQQYAARAAAVSSSSSSEAYLVKERERRRGEVSMERGERGGGDLRQSDGSMVKPALQTRPELGEAGAHGLRPPPLPDRGSPETTEKEFVLLVAVDEPCPRLGRRSLGCWIEPLHFEEAVPRVLLEGGLFLLFDLLGSGPQSFEGEGEGERGQKLGREGQRGGDDLPKHRHGHHGRVEGESVHESPLVRVGVCYDFCSSVRSVGVGCADANTTTKTRKHAGRGDCNVRSQHLARSLRLLSPCRLVPLNLVALYRSTKQHPRAS